MYVIDVIVSYSACVYIYMEIHVYSTLDYVRVGREERHHTNKINMHVHVPVH